MTAPPEAKFMEQQEHYSDLIRAHDADAIMDLLTDKSVERKVGPEAEVTRSICVSCKQLLALSNPL